METAVVDYTQYLQQINSHLADISIGIYLTVFALAVLLGVVMWRE